MELKGMYFMNNNKKPLIMRIAVIAIAAIMILGIVIGTVVGVYWYGTYRKRLGWDFKRRI